MSFTASHSDKFVTATMRIGTGFAYVEFRQEAGNFLVTAHVPGRDGQADQTIQYALNDGQRDLLLELVRQ